MAKPKFNAGKYFTVYKTPFCEQVEAGYKINLICTECGSKCGYFMASEAPNNMPDFIDCLRRSGAPFNFGGHRQDTLRVLCLRHLAT